MSVILKAISQNREPNNVKVSCLSNKGGPEHKCYSLFASRSKKALNIVIAFFHARMNV